MVEHTDEVEERRSFFDYMTLFQKRHNEIDTKLFDLTKFNFVACSAIAFISNTSYFVSKLPTGLSFVFFGSLISLISAGARAMAIFYARFAYANSLTAYHAHKSWVERTTREFSKTFNEKGIPEEFVKSGTLSLSDFFF